MILLYVHIKEVVEHYIVFKVFVSKMGNLCFLCTFLEYFNDLRAKCTVIVKEIFDCLNISFFLENGGLKFKVQTF